MGDFFNCFARLKQGKAKKKTPDVQEVGNLVTINVDGDVVAIRTEESEINFVRGGPFKIFNPEGIVEVDSFRIVSSIVTPLDKVNVDIDQLIPKQFLKLVCAEIRDEQHFPLPQYFESVSVLISDMRCSP